MFPIARNKFVKINKLTRFSKSEKPDIESDSVILSTNRQNITMKPSTNNNNRTSNVLKPTTITYTHTHKHKSN